MTLKVGDRIKHLGKGGIYIIVGECEFKDPTSREWKPAFLYLPWPRVGPPGEGRLCARSKEEFTDDRFRKIHTPI